MNRKAMLAAVLIGSCFLGTTTRADVTTASLEMTCPGSPNRLAIPTESLIGGIAELFLGSAVETVVESMGNALKLAAERDKNGTTREAPVKAISLYSVSNTAKKAIIAMQYCLVVANLPDLPPKNAGNCKTELMKYGEVSSAAKADSICAWTQLNTGLTTAPNFYTEVVLVPQPGNELAVAAPQTLVYHAPLDPKRSGAERSLNLTMQLRKPSAEGKGGTLLGTYIGALTSIAPATLRKWPRDSSPEALLDPKQMKAVTGWLVIEPPPEKPKSDGNAVPLDLNVSLHETGKTNPFLQFFAAAFEQNKAEIEKQLKSVVLPSERAKARLDAAKAENTQKIGLVEQDQAAETAWLAWKAAGNQTIDPNLAGFRTETEKKATIREKETLFRVQEAKANSLRLDADLPQREYDSYFAKIYGV